MGPTLMAVLMRYRQPPSFPIFLKKRAIDETLIAGSIVDSGPTNIDDERLLKWHPCPHCGKLFRLRSSLKQHSKRFHKLVQERGSLRKCRLCRFATRGRMAYKNHVCIHKGRRYQCTFCDECFIRSHLLVQHVVAKHNADPSVVTTYDCQHCSKTFLSVAAKQFHEKTHTSRHQCDCGAIFSSPKALKIHLGNNHSKLKHNCEMCNIQFLAKKMFESHIRRNHSKCSRRSNPRNRLHCPHCGKRFFTSWVLEQHLQQHNKDGATSQEMTGTADHSYSTIGGEIVLQQGVVKPGTTGLGQASGSQMATSTIGGLTVAFGCGMCDATFPTQEILIEHMSYSHKIGCDCSKCGRSFNSAKALSKHQQVGKCAGQPESSDPAGTVYRCPQCNYETVRKATLNIHMARHKDERPYLCSMCSYRGLLRNMLQRHMNIKHGATGRSVCKSCKMGFVSENSLLTHRRDKHQEGASSDTSKNPEGATTTQVYRFLCGACGFEAPTKDQLQEHIFATHFGTNIRPSQPPAPCPFVCNVCHLALESLQQLQQHMGAKHGGELSCKVCGETLLDREALSLHNKAKHPRRRTLKTCEVCGFKLQGALMLQRHMESRHGAGQAKQDSDKTGENSAEPTRDDGDSKGEVVPQGGVVPDAEGKHFKCNLCTYTAKRLGDLRIHMARHNGDMPYSCSVCDRRFIVKYTTKDHMMKKHKGRRPCICAYCGKCYDTEITLRAHELAGHGKDEIFPCENCKESYGNKVLLQMHVEARHKEKTYICKDCGFTTNRQKVLREHKEQHAEFVKTPCEHCGEFFKSGRSLQQHITSVHTSGERLKCKDCNATFVNEVTYQQHRTRKHSDLSHACDLCGRTFVSRENLAKHMSINHKHGQKTECAQCGKVFGTNAALRKHILTHAGVKAHQCETCGKHFSQASYLKDHRKIHTGERKYACSICGTQFDHMSKVKTHMMIHTGEKPFTCEVCGQGFRTASCLNRHNLSHTGEKPYECHTCAKRFTDRGSYTKHLRVLHPEIKPHMCQLCEQSFFTKPELSTHMMDHVKSFSDSSGEPTVEPIIDLLLGENPNAETVAAHVVAE